MSIFLLVKMRKGKPIYLKQFIFLALTRSHRTSSDKELIAFGKDYTNLMGHVHKSQVNSDLRVLITKKR